MGLFDEKKNRSRKSRDTVSLMQQKKINYVIDWHRECWCWDFPSRL
jgi:hypothetical protein